MEKTQAEAAAEAALSAPARAAEQESTRTDGKGGDHQDIDVQEPAAGEASGSDASSGGGMERQRRLESFELLDAAMDNVVDDDGSESADGHQESKAASEQQQDVDADGGGSQPVEAEQDIVVTEVQQVVPNVDSSAGHKVDVVEAQDVMVDEVSDMGHDPAAQALALANSVGNAHPVELTFVDVQRAPVEMSAMEGNTHDATDQSVPMESVSAISSEHIVAASELPITHGLVSGFEKYEPELLQWMQECQRNNHGLPASHDDVLFFMETKYPELLENVAGLFEWLTQFLSIYNQMLATRGGGITDMVDPEIPLVQQFDRFSDEFKLSAIQQLEETDDLTTVANEFGLKSTTTLVYWKYLRDNDGQLPASKGEEATEQGRRPSFPQEQHLLEWVLSHRETPITKQDIFSHMISAYPEFAVTKTAAALKMWITRFLKRHLSPGITASKDLMSALPVVEGLGIESESDLPANAVASGLQGSIAAAGVSQVSQVPTSKPPATASIPPTPVPQAKRREKRGCPDGYVLHSNEFKLNALRKLDEGKTISEVTEELGLKSQNTLAYWNSIRDKLATSEKKRFRLAGGGRRSSCTFEDELLSWVTERHQKGEGTDVKAVLDYMREFHPAFTDGKKEPTLRKWILRFFKRCLRTPSTTSGSGDVEKSMNGKKSGTRSLSTTSSATNAIEQLARQQQQHSQQLLTDRLHLRHGSLHRKSSYVQQLYAASEQVKATAVGRSKLSQFDEINERESARLSTIPQCQTPEPAPQCDKRALHYAISVTDFEKKYGEHDAMMQYAIRVIRDKSSVRRQDIPTGKQNAQRKIQLEEDVLYLVYDKSPPCCFRNVYWLQFTDEIQVQQNRERDYFTLGSLGFTHFQNSAVTEFFDIADWVDEKRAFDHMTMMKGLERIQQMLSFFSWKRKTIKNKHRRAQAQLACSLFTCHPVAAKILLKVRAICTEIEENANENQIQHTTTYETGSFVKIQRERLKLSQAFVTSKVAAICDLIANEVQQLRKSPTKEERSSISSSSAFSGSLQILSLCERMFNFLRLADLHLAESIFRHLEVFILDIHAQVCGGISPQHQLPQGRRSVVSSSVMSVPTELTADSQVTHLDLHSDAAKSEADCLQPIHFKVRFQLKDREHTFPVLYACLEESINFDADAQSFHLDIVPTKTMTYELLHGIIGDYMAGLDDIPKIFMDSRFSRVLTPFAPQHREDFSKSLAKSSGAILDMHSGTLKDIQHAVEAYFRQLNVLKTEHANCIDSIVRAQGMFVSNNYEGKELLDGRNFAELDNVSARHYEQAQSAWGSFLKYAKETPSLVQIGFLLLDQRQLVSKILRHASNKINEMDRALPGLYKLFLKDLLKEVDGRIEKVTKIPTSFEDATVWLTQISEMMPSHAFRQLFDAKCANLSKLQDILKDRGASWLESEAHERVRKLELDWESTFDTLMVCLDRVQDRDSEHRRSFHDLTTRTDEYIDAELRIIRRDFENIPVTLEERSYYDKSRSKMKKQEKDASALKNDIVQRLEKLVELDAERKSVVDQFTQYECEYRVLLEQRPFEGKVSTAVDVQKLPSELLLQQIVAAFELRKWFDSWNRLVEKWKNSPLSSIHSTMVMNRIRQFKRRLLHAVARLFPPSVNAVHSVASQEASFFSKDLELIQQFDRSIEQMTKDCRVFQAVSGTAFTEERWKCVDQMLQSLPASSSRSKSRSDFTFSFLKDQWGIQFPDQLNVFLDTCDQVIVESNIQTKMKQTQLRLSKLQVLVVEENFSVRCANILEALVELEDLLLGVKLFLHERNPELDSLLSLCGNIESKISICEQILSFQSKWFDVCQMTKLHDTDEYVTNRKSSLHAEKKSSEENSLWTSLAKTSSAWSDCIRQAFYKSFSNASGNSAEALHERGSVEMVFSNTSHDHDEIKSSSCSLDDIVEAFAEFDFEQNSASCESGLQLLGEYFNSLREIAPRLFRLSDADLLQLLVREDEILQIRQSLSICFPEVDAFLIGNSNKRTEFSSDFSPSSTTEGPATNDDSFEVDEYEIVNDNNTGSVVIRGIQIAHLSLRAEFNLAVLKIGRVKFWFTRLEDEMAALVKSNLRKAVQTLLGEGNAITISSAVQEKEVCQAILPQAIVLALILRFSCHMEQALLHWQSQQQQPDQPEPYKMFEELQTQIEQSLTGLISTLRNPPSGLRKGDPRIEIIVLLCSHQLRVLRHMIELTHSGDDSVIFWKMQLKIRMHLENSRSLTKTAKMDMEKKLLGFQVGDAVLATRADASFLHGMLYCAEIAHVKLALGHEYVGCSRLAVITPFTDRCTYAMMSAMKAHSMALIVPYTSNKFLQGQFSMLLAVAQVLMKASISFQCGEEIGSLTRIGNLIKATHALDGVLILHHFLRLPQNLRFACHDLFVQTYHQIVTHHHQAATAISRSVTTMSAAIMIPLNGDADLRASGLMDSLQSPFRAVSIVAPSISYFVEVSLVLDGLTPAQIAKMGVGLFFEGFAAAEYEFSSVTTSYSLTTNVIKEARRIRKTHKAVFDPNSSPEILKPNRRGSSAGIMPSNAYDQFSVVIEQSIFKKATNSIVLPMLTQLKNDSLIGRYQMLLEHAFPLSRTCEMVIDKFKGGSEEDDFAKALSISLESSNYGYCETQRDTVLEIWQAIRSYHGIVVYGAPGSGKTTCIKTLQHALSALEFARMQADGTDDAANSCNLQSVGDVSFHNSNLIVLNPKLFSLEELYGHTAQASNLHGTDGLLTRILSASRTGLRKQKTTPPRVWILVDGVLESAWIDPLLGLLPGHDRWLHLRDGSDINIDREVLENFRIIFEIADLGNVSPSTLVNCWTVHVPTDSISHRNIFQAWRDFWARSVVFPADSRGSQNVDVVFSMLELLVSTICTKFISEEMSKTESTPDPSPQESKLLHLGLLSMNQMTHVTLQLVTSFCFKHRRTLEEFSPVQVGHLVCFSVLWGFAGHLDDIMKHKLELFIRSQAKEFAELKYLCDLPGSIANGDHIDHVWDMLHVQYRPGMMSMLEGVTESRNPASEQVVYDPFSKQFLVITPSSRIFIRICRLLIRSSHSFLLTGPSATGKTSLLRLLRRVNEEEEEAEVMADASIDQRQVHGILNWLQMPNSWFRPTAAALDPSGARSKFREEADLFAPRTTHSFIFIDDLGLNVMGEVEAQEEFIRFLLDHRVAFSRKEGKVLPLEKQIGAAMRVDDAMITSERCPSGLIRLIRHFIVLQVPSYDRNQLLSVFRIKYQTYFQNHGALSVKSGENQSSQQHRSDRLLSMEETVLRATVDLAIELSGIQQAVDKTSAANVSLFTFNLHHMSALLERTLAFGASMQAYDASTTLLKLGKLHQAWMSEIRNMFLVNYPSSDKRPSINGAKPTRDSPRSQTDAIQREWLQKVWITLRLISEKYFSVSLREDNSALASSEVVYFTLRLAAKYSQLSVVEQLKRLREIMTTNASASSLTGRNHHANQASNMKTRESTTETIQRILLQLASSVPWPSSSPPARCYKPGDLSALEVKLLMGSSFGLNKTLHLLHALDGQRHLVISAPDSRSIAKCLLRFACDTHGLQVKRLDANHDISSQDDYLRAIVHSAVIQNERVALWINCDGNKLETLPSLNLGHSALLDLIRELCLNQIPSLLFRSGALRDVAIISFIQNQSKLTLATERDILNEFLGRVQRNIRLCLFVDRSLSPQGRAPLSPALVEWMKTRENFQWFCVEKIPRLDAVMAEIADVAISHLDHGNLLQDTFITRSTLVSLCHQIHQKMTSSTTAKMSECVQLNYYLSFLKNFAALYDRKRKEWDKRVAVRQKMLSTLQSIHECTSILETRISDLEERASYLRDAQTTAIQEAGEHQLAMREEEAIMLQNSNEDDVDDEAFDTDAIRMREEYSTWVYRSKCEEFALMIEETNFELEQIAEALRNWSEVAAVERENAVTWEKELNMLLSMPARKKLMADTMLQSALTAYSYVASLSKIQMDVCVANVKESLSVLGQDELPTTASDIEDGTKCCISGHIASSEDCDMQFVRMLWALRSQYLRNCNALDAICLADNICDRLPVFIDQGGILRRFFIHLFSGHSIFSSLSDAKDVSRTDGSQAAMIVMCEDQKLEVKLQEAQRRNVPVLLLNFQLRQTLPRLVPFLEFASGHQRQPVLSTLTKLSYETHLAEKEARKKKKSHQPSLDPLTASSSGVDSARKAVSLGIIDSKVKPTRKKVGASLLSSSVANAAAAAAAVASPMNNENIAQPKTPSTAEANHRHWQQGTGFQLYAVTSTPIHIEDQYEHSMDLAIFSVDLDTTALKEFFQEAWIRKCNFKLHLDVHEVASAQVESMHHSMQLERQLRESLVADPSDGTEKIMSIPWALKQLRHYQLVPQQLADLDRDQRCQRAENFLTRERCKEIAKETEKYSWIAAQFVGIATCMTAVNTFTGSSSQLYARSYRWLEYTIERQLDMINDRHHSTRRLELLENHEDIVCSVTAEVVQQLVSGFASKSHRQIFFFLLTVERQAQRSGGQQCQAVEGQGYRSAYERAIQLLSNSGRKINEDTPQGLVFSSFRLSVSPRSTSEELPGIMSAQGTQLKSQSSMVNKLRRKIRMCAFVFDHLKESMRPQGSTRRKTDTREVDFVKMAPALRSSKEKKAGHQTLSIRQPSFQERATSHLHELLASVEVFWSEWRQKKHQAKVDLQRLLRSPGIQKSRLVHRKSVGVSDALVQVSNMIALVDRDGVYDEYGVTNPGRHIDASELTSFEKQMGRMLVTKMYFPDAFADAMDEYILDQTSVEDRATISTGVPLPWTHTLSPTKANQGLESCFAALISDIAPLRGQERIHLPDCIITYDLRKRNRAEMMLSSWMQATNQIVTVLFWENGSLRDQLTTLVTSKGRFAVEILNADHFERVISLVSQLINQHTLLSLPQWYILASLPVANTIQSSLFPLIQKSVIVRRTSNESSELGSDVKRWFAERGVSESFASEWVKWGCCDDNCTGSLPILGNLRDLTIHYKTIEDTFADEGERRQLMQTLMILTSTRASQNEYVFECRKCLAHDTSNSGHAESPSVNSSNSKAQIQTSNDDTDLASTFTANTERQITSEVTSASYSAELLCDLLFLGQSMAAAKIEISAVPQTLTTSNQENTRDMDNHQLGVYPLDQLDRLCDQIGCLYVMLRDELITRTEQNSELPFFPWQSLADEFEAHFKAFVKVNTCYQSLKAAVLKQPGHLSLNTLQELTSLANGLIPFEWMMLAFTNTVGPSTSISIPQLVLLVTCRLGLLVNYVSLKPLTCINLAVLSDVRGFLRNMKHHCAAEWNTPMANIVLMLKIEPRRDNADANSNERDFVNEKARVTNHLQRPGSVFKEGEYLSTTDTAVVRDDEGFLCGFRVDGLVVIEQSKIALKYQQTNLYPLPLCRLYCAKLSNTMDTETREEVKGLSSSENYDSMTAVPLVMLPSLSPYQQPPRVSTSVKGNRDNDAILEKVVCLGFSIPAVIPALAQPRREGRCVTFAIGAPMFPDDED